MTRNWIRCIFVSAALVTSTAAISQEPPPAEELEPAVDTSPEPSSAQRAPASAGSTPAARPNAPTPRVMDRLELDATQITGNRELPKVLYIVPWKKPLQGDMSGRPLGGVLDEALAPVDRDVFRRQVRYDGITQARPAAPAAK